MKDVVDFLKLPPHILAAISVVSGAILFLPISILQKLGLNDIQQFWKMLIGVSFLISSTLFIILIIIRLHSFIRNKINKKKFQKQFPKTIENLSIGEKIVLIAVYKTLDKTMYLPTTNGIIARLLSKIMLQFTSRTNISHGYDIRVPLTITPIAQKYLDDNPDFIENTSKVAFKYIEQHPDFEKIFRNSIY